MTPASPIGRFYPDEGPVQTPADIAVVMPTVIRSEIAAAIQSVYDQRFAGRIQLAIGIDVALGDPGLLEAVLRRRSPSVSALVLQLPYSTSVRHGGAHTPADGGSLRAVLSLMANARYVAFLDDDNSWLPQHLTGLHAAAAGKTYAFAPRMLLDDETGRDLCVDRWHSTGPGRGQFAEIGGFVDPNCLLVDKALAAQKLSQWAQTWTGKPNRYGSDKRFFASIAAAPHGEVSEPTVRYSIRRDNVLYRLATEPGG
jgi:hypothetical protein